MRRAINSVFQKPNSGKLSFSTLEKLPSHSLESQISKITQIQDKSAFTKELAELWKEKSRNDLKRSNNTYSFIPVNELRRLTHPVPRMIAEIFQDIPEQDSLPTPISDLLKVSSNLFGYNYEYLGNHAFLEIFLKKEYTLLAYSCYEAIIRFNRPVEQGLTDLLIYQLAANNHTDLIQEFLKKHSLTLNMMFKTSEPLILSGNLSFYQYLMKKYINQQPFPPTTYQIAEVLKVLMISLARRSFQAQNKWTNSEESALIALNQLISQYFVDHPPKDIDDLHEQIYDKMNNIEGRLSSQITTDPLELAIVRVRDSQVIFALFLYLTEKQPHQPRLKSFHGIISAYHASRLALDSYLELPAPSLYSYPFIGEDPSSSESIMKIHREEDLSHQITEMNLHSKKQSFPLYSAYLFPRNYDDHCSQAPFFVQFLLKDLKSKVDENEEGRENIESEHSVDEDDEEETDSGVSKSLDKDVQKKVLELAMKHAERVLEAYVIYEEDEEDIADDEEDMNADGTELNGDEDSLEDNEQSFDSVESVDGSEGIYRYVEDKLDGPNEDDIDYINGQNLLNILFDGLRKEIQRKDRGGHDSVPVEHDFEVEDISSELYRKGQNHLKYESALFEDSSREFVSDVLATVRQVNVKNEDQIKTSLESDNKNEKDATSTPPIMKGINESNNQNKVETFKKDV